MVVLSVSICTKSGKALLSRQFVPMTRIRIEGLLAAFPKLMGTDSTQQHTFIETESVRYVYHPMENLYLLLITNRASNIVEDLDTLRLLSKVVPNVTSTTNNLTEEKVHDHCFDLIFAFDEVITAGGYKEPITLAQIRTNMEMESHEEKLHQMIQRSKQETAREQSKSAAASILAKQKEMANRPQYGGEPRGFGSDSAGSSSSFGEPSYITSPAVAQQQHQTAPVAAPSRSTAVKGMQLGGAKNKSVEDALMKEDNLAPALLAKPKAGALSGSETVAQPVISSAVQHPVMLVVSEKVSATISRDGGLDMFEIKGSLTLTAATDEAAFCAVQLIQANMELFQF